MKSDRKITVHVPGELLDRAQAFTGMGITETIRQGLKLVAAGQAFERLRQLKGRVQFSLSTEDLKRDRK